MAQKLDRKQTASWEEIAYTNMLQLETLTRLLIKAGVFSRDNSTFTLQRVSDFYSHILAYPILTLRRGTFTYHLTDIPQKFIQYLFW